LFAKGQRPPLPMIGFLSSRSPDESATHAAAFRRGSSDSCYVDRENVIVEYRWARGDCGRLPELASGLAKMAVNVLGCCRRDPVRAGSQGGDRNDSDPLSDWRRSRQPRARREPEPARGAI